MTEIITAAVTAVGLIVVQLIVSSRQQRAQENKEELAYLEHKK